MNRNFIPLFCTLLAATLSFGFTKTDKPEGWASQNGGTTGGTGGTEVTVGTMAELQAQAKSSGKKIILVNKGTYTGAVTVASDKTILGKEPGVLVQGMIKISGVSNVIIRNIAVKGDHCGTYDECKAGDDAININNEAHNIWLDHMNVSDGQDGNCDISNGSDFVTVTWSKFWYSYDKEHRFSNLIAGADNVAIDKGKLNITYGFCWWADRVMQRQPRGRAGKVHVVNNLYTSTAADYACGPGVDIQMLIENNVFKNSGYAIEPFNTATPAPAYKSTGNIGTAKDMGIGSGTVFTPPYALSQKMSASEVEAKVRPEAGNTMTLGTSDLAPPVSARNPSEPYVIGSNGAWRLRNPGAKTIRFDLVDPSGKILLATSLLGAGRDVAIPSIGNAVIVRFPGSQEAKDIYLPFSK